MYTSNTTATLNVTNDAKGIKMELLGNIQELSLNIQEISLKLLKELIRFKIKSSGAHFKSKKRLEGKQTFSQAYSFSKQTQSKF